jgi:hypothetical protein
MTEARRFGQLAVLLVIGLAVGVWLFVSPWVLAYPSASRHWSHSTWTSIWTGGILIAASGAGLVGCAALGVRAAIRGASAGIS